MTLLMPVGMGFTVKGGHCRRLPRPRGILRRPLLSAYCVGCGTAGIVWFLALMAQELLTGCPSTDNAHDQSFET